MLAPNASGVTLLGAVGNAAGLLLHEHQCAEAECADAVSACLRLPRCDTVEMRLPSQKRRLRRNGSPVPAMPPVAILRSSWTTWSVRDATLNGALRACQALTREARLLRPGRWLSKQRRLTWQQTFCDEYVGSGAQPPDFGRLLTPEESSLPSSGTHCPPAGTDLFIVTYQNAPSPWLCTFLRTLGYHNVHVTVLGWQPREFVRANNVFYFTDRVYTLLRYLVSCPSLAPGASIMFCDTDELFQLHGGMPELLRRTRALYASTAASVVISAEARCMPNRLGRAAWEHSEAIAHMPKKWPRCLNTGNFVGRVSAAIDLLNRTCIPCRDGTPVQEVFRRYTRAYSAQVRSWIYSEQAELMRLYLAQPSNHSGWILDFGQVLFHPNFWFTAAVDMRVLADGRLRNKHTGSTAAFIHYNGDSKRTWRGPHSPSALAQALRRRYTTTSGDTKLDLLDNYMRNGVSFLTPTFERDTSVAFSDVCRRGGLSDAPLA